MADVLGPGANRIEFGPLSAIFQRLKSWIGKVEKDKRKFKESIFAEFQKDLTSAFNDWIDWRRGIELKKFDKKVAKEVVDRTKSFMDTHEATIKSRFDQQINRAFALALVSIREALDQQRGPRFKFGLGALARILRRLRRGSDEPEVKDPGPDRKIEGFNRLATSKTGKVRSFNIGLVPYIKTLIVTSQLDWRHRFMSEATFALGGDLVVIDNHPPKARMRGKKKEICEIWRGKVISLTGLTKTFKGKKVATLREVKAQGMFHPNCTHGYQPLTSDVRQDLLT